MRTFHHMLSWTLSGWQIHCVSLLPHSFLLKAFPGCRAAGTVWALGQSLHTLLIPVSTAPGLPGPRGPGSFALRPARGAGSLVTEQSSVKDEADAVPAPSRQSVPRMHHPREGARNWGGGNPGSRPDLVSNWSEDLRGLITTSPSHELSIVRVQ